MYLRAILIGDLYALAIDLGSMVLLAFASVAASRAGLKQYNSWIIPLLVYVAIRFGLGLNVLARLRYRTTVLPFWYLVLPRLLGRISLLVWFCSMVMLWMTMKGEIRRRTVAAQPGEGSWPPAI